MRYLIQFIIWILFIATLILWPAGTLAFPAAWVLIGIFAFGGFAMIFWLGKYSPELLRERMASPIQRSQKPWDRVWLMLFIFVFFGWLGFMSWDAARTGFIAVPPWLQALGGLGILTHFLGVLWTFRENAFAAPVVKIQESQKVIDTGPYAIVRHPMYASSLFLFLGVPLLLGSWLGFLFAILFIPALAWRTTHEERMLRDELRGYNDYASRVRYRFIPYVW